MFTHGRNASNTIRRETGLVTGVYAFSMAGDTSKAGQNCGVRRYLLNDWWQSSPQGGLGLETFDTATGSCAGFDYSGD